MKKFALMFTLLFVLSVSGFAEGEIPLGGKNCPQGQTCVADDGTTHSGGKSCAQGQTCFAKEGDIHTGGKTCPEGQTCLANDGTTHTGGKSENTIIKNIFDFLKSMFG